MFDIIRIKSTHPGGNRAALTRNGQTYCQMVPKYTNEGYHLVLTGRETVAAQRPLMLDNRK